MKSPDRYSPSGQCCQLDEPYQAPPGYFDQPFIYTYDADQLVGGGSIPNGQDVRLANIITHSGADFILRRVAGQDRVCTQFQLRDVMARLIFDTTQGVSTAGFNDFALIPELLFPAASGITFDLLNVQKTLNSSGTPLSQVVFQGVRRFRGYKRPPSYPYWEDPYDYAADVAITWTANDPPVRFFKNIYNFDFELLKIHAMVINPIGGGAPQVSSGNFKMQLYDQVYEQVFFRPVIDDLLVDNGSVYQSVTPVPGIVYRVGQQLRFDVTSLVTPGSCPVQVQIRFQGVRRRPC